MTLDIQTSEQIKNSGVIEWTGRVTLPLKSTGDMGVCYLKCTSLISGQLVLETQVFVLYSQTEA